MSIDRRSLALFILAAVVGALLFVWTRFADLWAPSVGFYAGFLVCAVGLVSLIVPPRFIGIRSRKGAGIVALAGLAVSSAALWWPAGQALHRAAGSSELDRMMPQFDLSEKHEVQVHASVTEVRRAIEEVTFSDIRGLQVLLSLRAGKQVRLAPKPMLETMTGPRGGFTLLARSADEFVAGNVGRPWRNEAPQPIRNSADYLGFNSPGYVKAAFNLRIQETAPGSCRVTTETRILATDEAARQAFTRYWRVVYPGSALIRVLWLDAIQRCVQSLSPISARVTA